MKSHGYGNAKHISAISPPSYASTPTDTSSTTPTSPTSTSSPTSPSTVPTEAAFYVSPLGHDDWSGKLAAPNADGTDGPFATLQHAQAALRADPAIDTLYLRGGTYHPDQALQLTQADNGIKILAYPGEKPVLSGGQELTGFSNDGNGLYSVALPSPNGLDLTIGGVRQHAAQTGDWDPANPYTSGWLVGDALPQVSATQFRFHDGDLTPQTVAPGTQIQVFNSGRWGDNITSVTAVDFTNHIITLHDSHWSGPYDNGTTYRLLNNAAYIKDAGEFGWRASDGHLVVKPASPATFEADGIVLPRLDSIIKLNGTQNITINGLTFTDVPYTGNAIALDGASQTKIGGNSFANVGTAVRLFYSTDNKIAGNSMDHLGNNGIELASGSNNNQVYDNVISHVGEITKSNAGIYAYGASNNMIAYNDISETARYGISIKNWSPDTAFHDNVITHNRIVHTNRETADTGAIELLGRSDLDTRTVISDNYIEDTGSLRYDPAGKWVFGDQSSGIYLDDLTNGVQITRNFIKGAGWAQVFVHGGDNNTVTNNIGIIGRETEDFAAIVRNGNLTTGVDPLNNRFEHNILYAETPVKTAWHLDHPGTYTIDNNLLYNIVRQTGTDAHSTIGDPLFTNAPGGNYSLTANSPALKMGIADLDWVHMGTVGYPADTGLDTLPHFWSDAH